MAAVSDASSAVRVGTRCMLALVTLTLTVLPAADAPASPTASAVPVAVPAAAATSPTGSPAASVVSPATFAGPPAAAKEVPSALAVTIETLTPTVLRADDRIEVSGTITNVDDQRWSAINAFLVISAGALTTRQELQDAADSPDTSYIGDRVVEPEAFQSVGDLAPGESVGYTLRVPYRLLDISGASGVYQLGVQVLGTDETGTRSLSATGRARTFVPLVQPGDASVMRTSLLWPLMSPVRRVADGRVINADRLLRLCGPGGRLRTLLDLAARAPGAPLTLMLDPALLDALGDLATGTANRPVEDVGDGPDLTAPGALAEYVRTTPNEESSAQRTARTWLRDLLVLAERVPVMVSGYAGPDLAALPTRASPDVAFDPVPVPVGRRLRAVVDQATAATLRSLDLTATPLWWPPGGYADTLALTRAAPSVAASVVTAESLPLRLDAGAALLRVDTATSPAIVVVDDPAYLDGGPGPGDTDSALQVRQRIAAETALQALDLASQGRRIGNAAVVLDRRWDPGVQWAGSAFFTAFSTSWTRVETLSQQLDRRLPVYGGEPVVPAIPEATPLPAAVVEAAAVVDRRSRVLAELLRGTTVTETAMLRADKAASVAISHRWRDQPRRGAAYARRTARSLVEDLRSVSVEVPSFVTLSSRSGRFGITITNQLDSAVSVGVDFDAGRFTLPDISPLRIGAGERRTVLVSASVTDVAVAQVRARLTTVDGSQFGRPATFTLRTSTLGVAIWIALGAGAGFVVLLVLRRSWRQARSSRVAR